MVTYRLPAASPGINSSKSLFPLHLVTRVWFLSNPKTSLWEVFHLVVNMMWTRASVALPSLHLHHHHRGPLASETRSHSHTNSLRTRLAFYSATCSNQAPLFPPSCDAQVCHEASDKNLSFPLTDRREAKPQTAVRRRPIPLAPSAPEIGPVFVRGFITGMRPPPSASLRS